MQIKRKVMSGVVVVMMLGTILAGSLPAYAATTTTTTSTASRGDFFSGLVKYVAQKFGLDEAKVSSAIKEYEDKNKPTEADMKAREKERLDKLVTQGKITSDQETKIIAEMSLMRSKYNPEDMDDLSKDARNTKFQQMQAELKAFASANGINESYLRGGFGGHGGPHGMRGMNREASVTVTPTPAN